MSDAATIARVLGGKPSGDGFLIRCPALGHGAGRGDLNPSCRIADGDIPGCILVRCFAGCDAGAILGGLRAARLIEEPALRRSLRPHLVRDASRPPEPDPDANALRIWLSASSVHGSIAERYLREQRRIGIDIPLSLRFGDAFHIRTGRTMPALIAAIARPTDRKIVAIQATFLTLDGGKAPIEPPRLTFGKLGTGAIRLAQCGAELGIAEGCEKALAVKELTGVPCWSSVGASRLVKITLPESIRTVHIFADNDEVGQREAERAAQKFTREGRRVYVRTPRAGFKDYGDLLRARSADVAA